MILDVHHHGSLSPQSVTSISVKEEIPSGDGFISVGIHPWDEFNPFDIAALYCRLRDPRVVAIGEAGVDLLRGQKPELQAECFREQVVLSEKLELPLVIHCVKAVDIILRIRKQCRPEQPWIFHGFRGKPGQARQLIRMGIKLSFGERFNPDTVADIPLSEILVETDVSPLGIDEIIEKIAAARQCDASALREAVAGNTSAIFRKKC